MISKNFEAVFIPLRDINDSNILLEMKTYITNKGRIWFIYVDGYWRIYTIRQVIPEDSIMKYIRL